MNPISRPAAAGAREHACAFLDIVVHRVTREELNQAAAEAIRQGRRLIIANHNLHSLYLYHRDKQFRGIFEAAGLTHADGIGIILLSALSRAPLSREHRTTYVDWTPDLISAAAENRWRVFYVGSKPGIALIGAAKLIERYPGLRIETAHGYFDQSRSSDENRALLGRIRDFQPHILMVGMGMPRQEKWILENLEDLSCNVILPCGAAIDYVAGVVPTPPRWSGPLGLEWLFRLAKEPRRLASRYLVEPWYVAGLVLAHLAGLRAGNGSPSSRT